MKKMVRKTYAARGLLDFQMALNVAGSILKICFSGGTMGSNGVLPAKYITDNPIIQKYIEKSPQFHSNRVYIYSVVEISDKARTVSGNPAKDKDISKNGSDKN